jgi:hypothetical protein
MSRRVWIVLAVLASVVGVLSFSGAGRAVAATAPSAAAVPAAAAPAAALSAAAVSPVTHLTAGAVTDSAVTLSWQWPSDKTVISAVIRMAKGAIAPASPTAGHLAGSVSRPGSTLRVSHLAAYTRYAFAVFAKDKSGHYASPVHVTVVTRPLPLKLATRALATGIRGLFYIQKLSASGGVAPYTWTVTGLPPGLSAARAGVISGYPRTTGTRTVTIRAKDARGTTVRGTLRLAVPTSLPAACVAKTCAQLSRNTHTVQVPGKDVVSVTRSPVTGKVTSVVLSGVAVAAGDILVLPPAAAIPSGLIVAASSVTTSGVPARETVAVSQATPAAAYYQGIVQTIAPPASVPRPRPVRPAAGADLTCDGSVTAEVHGLTVTPALKASIGLEWKHNLFGGKGIYAGYGGLKLFQIGLTGTVTVDLGASISGKATCTMDLPEVHDVVPAGPLGAVLITYSPSVTLTVTGAVAVDTSVTLNCYAGYQWNKGVSTRTDYCSASHQPLGLSSDSGLDATLTGGIEVSAALDDLPGIKGSIDDSLHLGYHPVQVPVAELDAGSDYELKATLANIWKGAPTLTLAHGEFFHETLATWGSPPPGDNGTPTITVSPAEALVWNDTVCGFDVPTNGWSNTFTVSGTGFKPGEKVTISTGWETYPGTVTAAPDGSFDVTEFVGEVPSVLNENFAVDAVGSGGSAAGSSIMLDSDGCVHPADSGGTVDMTWGGNGFDPGSEVDLYINDVLQASATTDNLGSGGSVTTFTCPASGSYTWSVSGTVSGGGVGTTDQTLDCTPAAAAVPRHAPPTAGAAAVAVASSRNGARPRP